MVKKAVGFIGEIRWDKSKPDGTPRKLLDVAKIRGLGLKPKISVEGGIAATYDWFLKNAPEAKAWAIGFRFTIKSIWQYWKKAQLCL